MSGVFVRGKRIYLSFTYEGRRYREMLDDDPTPENLKFAEGLREKILREIKNGNFQFEKYFPRSAKSREHAKKNPRQPISMALDEFMARARLTCQKSTLKDYQSSIDCHLKPTFGNFQLCDLTAEHIAQWISGLKITRKRVSNILVPLRMTTAHAITKRLIDEDPFFRVPELGLFVNLDDGEEDTVDPFNPTEIQKILGAMKGQVRNFFKFAFSTGLRTSELIALKWSDINRDNNTIKVQRAYVLQEMKKTKTSSGKRDVDLNAQAISALKDQGRYTGMENDFIFHDPDTNKIWQGDGALRKKAWKPALELSGIRYRYPYQTRHTWASLALLAREPELYVAKQLGHANVEMVRRHYGKYIPGADTDAGKRIDKVFQDMKDLGNDDFMP